MKNSKLRIYYLALMLLLISVTIYGQNEKVFIMVHFEAGRDTTHPLINEIVYNELGYPPDSLTTNSLYFQSIFWSSLVHMVQTADTFNIKLTLALQSQMAEYIIKDPNKISVFNNWINNGHEFAMHHHGVNHIDWSGYTNRFQGTSYPDDYMWIDKYQNSGLYRGNMLESFNYLQQLATAINDSIVTGCIGDTQIDKPDGILYLTEGGEEQVDLIASPDTVPIPNNPLYFLSHYQVVSVYKNSNDVIIEDDSINHQKAQEALDYVMSNINQIDNDEIMGIVFHVFDYYRFPDIYRDLFSFFNLSSVNNKSIKCLMNDCNTTGTNVDYSENNIEIYPNPTNGVFIIDNVNSFENVIIYNSIGQVVCDNKIHSNKRTIDLSNKSNGIYFVHLLSTNKENMVIKLIKNM